MSDIVNVIRVDHRIMLGFALGGASVLLIGFLVALAIMWAHKTRKDEDNRIRQISDQRALDRQQSQLLDTQLNTGNRIYNALDKMRLGRDVQITRSVGGGHLHPYTILVEDKGALRSRFPIMEIVVNPFRRDRGMALSVSFGEFGPKDFYGIEEATIKLVIDYLSKHVADYYVPQRPRKVFLAPPRG